MTTVDYEWCVEWLNAAEVYAGEPDPTIDDTQTLLHALLP